MEVDYSGFAGIVFLNLQTTKTLNIPKMEHISDRVNSLAASATLAMSQKSAELKAQGIDTIAQSSTKAEYRGATVAACDVAWLRKLLADLGLHVQCPVFIYCDNIYSI